MFRKVNRISPIISRSSNVFNKNGIICRRNLTTSRTEDITKLLQDNLKPTQLAVVDISGGCGQSFRIEIESPEFKGKTILKQHQTVNALLKDQFKEVHAIQLETKASE